MLYTSKETNRSASLLHILQRHTFHLEDRDDIASRIFVSKGNEYVVLESLEQKIIVSSTTKSLYKSTVEYNYHCITFSIKEKTLKRENKRINLLWNEKTKKLQKMNIFKETIFYYLIYENKRNNRK